MQYGENKLTNIEIVILNALMLSLNNTHTYCCYSIFDFYTEFTNTALLLITLMVNLRTDQSNQNEWRLFFSAQ